MKRRRCEENEKVIDLTLSAVFKKTVKLKRTPEEMKNNIIFCSNTTPSGGGENAILGSYETHFSKGKAFSHGGEQTRGTFDVWRAF